MTDYPSLYLFIGGERLSGGGRRSEPVLNPATGTALAELPHASAQDLDRALEAAQAGFRLWREVSPYDRAAVLRRAAEGIRARREEIARLITLEEGKPLAESRQEAANAADFFEWFAEEGRRAYGRIIPGRTKGGRGMVLREPVGPALALAAWNVPAQTTARKVGAALAAGCSVIMKPSEETPATPLLIARILQEAGVPDGVVNIVFGVPDEVSRHLMGSPIIRKVTFTGSTAVGKHLTRLSADNMQRITMELGGHAPVIVFPDAPVEAVARAAVAAKYRNAGQICVSPTRFYLHEAIHDRFVAAFVGHAKDWRVGDGLDEATQMGPMANPRRVEAMERLVADARAHGATVACGGERIGNEGFFYRPTVLTEVPDRAAVMDQEPFGPLAVMRRFHEPEEALEQANRLPYGLAAYAFTDSARRATQVADGLQAGVIAINSFVVSTPETPFGGVKESGFGSEGGIEGLDAFLTTKFVNHA
jgi:succinate-semialdehyde dehydrogenase/glutarate-semialdehyde dehydrogenase